MGEELLKREERNLGSRIENKSGMYVLHLLYKTLAYSALQRVYGVA